MDLSSIIQHELTRDTNATSKWSNYLPSGMGGNECNAIDIKIDSELFSPHCHEQC